MIAFEDSISVTGGIFEEFQLEAVSVEMTKDNIIIGIPFSRKDLLGILGVCRANGTGKLQVRVGGCGFSMGGQLLWYSFSAQKQNATSPLRVYLYFPNDAQM